MENIATDLDRHDGSIPGVSLTHNIPETVPSEASVSDLGAERKVKNSVAINTTCI